MLHQHVGLSIYPNALQTLLCCIHKKFVHNFRLRYYGLSRRMLVVVGRRFSPIFKAVPKHMLANNPESKTSKRKLSYQLYKWVRHHQQRKSSNFCDSAYSRQASITHVKSIRPSAFMSAAHTRRTDICCWGFYLQSIQKLQIWLKR
jgi:hypothetical protein